MTDIAAEIEKLSPGPGDLVIVRLPADLEDAELNEQAWRIGQAIRADARGGTVLVVKGDVQVEALNEQTMRAAGWVRAEP